MSRSWMGVALGGWLTVHLLGCANMLETRAITAFTEGLESADVETIRSHSTDSFNESVLRRDDALDAMKQLSLPTGKTKIVEVTERDNEKTVIVEVGEQKRKLEFNLVRDERTRKWLIDDIEVKRKTKPGQVNKTLSQQMELLLAIRDILDAWELGDKAAVLSTTTAPFGEVLGHLPEPVLTKLASRVTGDVRSQKGLKPVIEGHADTAVVKITRPGSDVLLTLRFVDDKWRVDDVHLQSNRDDNHVPSLKNYAAVQLMAISFYDAYQSGDKQQIKPFCTPKFFDKSLSIADLSLAPLPKDVQFENLEIKLQKPHALVMLRNEQTVVQLTLRQKPDETAVEAGLHKVLQHQVEEVTLHNLNGKEERRLSSFFTAQAMMHVFAAALVERDLKTLQLTSTTDFNTRVWSKLDTDALKDIPLPGIELAPPVVTEVVFQGAVTQVFVNQGNTPLTYLLRDQGGELRIDDIEYPSLDRKGELKQALEVLMPIRYLARAMERRDLPTARLTASKEFCRVVWNTVDVMPPTPAAAPKHLRATMSHLQVTPERAIVLLGSEQWGAKVYLVREGSRFVIDDITLINGLETAQRLALKQHLRSQLASSQPAAKALPR